MLDMRLDYENNMDAIVMARQSVKTKLQKLKRIIQSTRSTSSKYNLLRKMTENFQPSVLFGKLQEKKKELQFNIFQIINNYCTKIERPIELGGTMFKVDGYNTHEARCNMSGNNIIYTSSGKFDVMIKKMPIEMIENFPKTESFLIALSKVAIQMRMSECLLNPQAYNVTDVKFDDIYRSIVERTSALSGLLLNKITPYNLDSIPAIDCNYYTPDPQNPRRSGKGFNELTNFYLTFPYVTSNLEGLFFFEPRILRSFLSKYSWLKNNLSLRINMSLKMIEALISLHKSGIIHKNINLSTIFYHDFGSSSGSPNQINLSFGNFSSAGIDDYDARVMPSFFIPEDIKVELGPKLDTYQLGLVIFQLTFMIPTEGTHGLTFSKIAKIIDKNYFFTYSGKKYHLFERLMIDAAQGNTHYHIYADAMTEDAARCSIGIFKEIYLYFKNKLWFKEGPKNDDLNHIFYRFKPHNGDTYEIQKLYKYRRFKKIFVIVFLNLFPYVRDCYGDIYVSESFLTIIRSLIHPKVDRRIDLVKAKDLLKQELIKINTSKYVNPTYSIFDNTKLRHKGRNSILKKQLSNHEMI
jgi:serine/threonine protein kinase